MKKIHIITQTKSDYYTEKYQVLRFIWWGIASVLFTSLFYLITKSWDNLFYIFAVFVFLFIISDLTKNMKIKAYIKVLIGILYSIWSLIFIYITIVIFKTKDERIMGAVLTLIFIYLGYSNINRYTNIFSKSVKIQKNNNSKKNKDRNNNRFKPKEIQKKKDYKHKKKNKHNSKFKSKKNKFNKKKRKPYHKSKKGRKKRY